MGSRLKREQKKMTDSEHSLDIMPQYIFFNISSSGVFFLNMNTLLRTLAEHKPNEFYIFTTSSSNRIN